MDFHDENMGQGPTERPGHPPSSAGSQPVVVVQEPKKRGFWRVLGGILFALSVLANIVLVLMVIGVFALLVTGQADLITERVIEPGPRTSKIAVINLRGIIEAEKSRDICEQLKHAAKDDNVKAIILRVDSPGGTISGSDQIHNEILKCRTQGAKPVLASMQGLAASGAYYVSVACDKIIAEPTTITGSVGVIMGYLVLQDLLEGKLGIQPVIVKSGEKKDWPSSFKKPTSEELKYLQEKVIDPAYERFVQIVSDGRGSLTTSDVRRLADGSIYTAQEALNEKMVDAVGYFSNAVDQAMSLAGIDKAQVVEYKRPFSLASFMRGRAGFLWKIDKATLYELSTPQVLYLWSIY